MTTASVITIGNFDGVHLGHQALLRRAVELAKACGGSGGGASGGRVLAMTFDPHPATLLRPDAVPPRLCGMPQKTDLLQQCGADEVVRLHVTRELLSQTPERFITNLVETYQPAAVVEGPDFRFGHERLGDVAMLKTLGERLGFQVSVVEPVQAALSDQLIMPVSSSRIRWLLGQGRVADAAICLGRCHGLSARVVKGEQRGRTINVPTANLDMRDLTGLVLPADAVYAGLARLENGQTHPAAISVGVKPTFGKTSRVIEAHLLDYHGDLYGQTMLLTFTRWLRDQQPFPGVEALRRQLADDLAKTRRWAALEGFERPLSWSA